MIEELTTKDNKLLNNNMLEKIHSLWSSKVATVKIRFLKTLHSIYIKPPPSRKPGAGVSKTGRIDLIALYRIKENTG